MPDSPVILNKRNYRAAFGDFDSASGGDFVWPDEVRIRRRRLIYAILGVTGVFFVAGAASTMLLNLQGERGSPAIRASAASLVQEGGRGTLEEGSALQQYDATQSDAAQSGATQPTNEQTGTTPSEGLTVLARHPQEKPVPANVAPVQQAAAIDDPPPPEPAPVPAPVTAGELGYAIELGGARSFSELSKRFAQIADANQEIDFDRMEPRVTLSDTAAGVEARLLVGPFDSLVEAEETCAQIALPAGVGCQPAAFAGEVIARK
jgi:hypothetical protein